MDKVLQSNPILEAFGNAKTLRNDNSSRFGKFIELNFNKRGHLIGSRIKTYLLEKVRLPSQQRGERNFHVFYQILTGATALERERWCLRSVEEFIYTAQGGVFQLRDMDDGEGFQELRQGLQTLNFRAEDQSSLFDIVAGLLHLGQVEFQAVFDAEGEGSSLSGAEDCTASMATVAALCGLSVADIVHTLTVRTIVAREETYVKKLTPVQASDARDAVAKAIYGRLFDWIVYTINLSIQVDSKQVRANIGVLDIFGFECFVNNSFEQLCINYTNETLQQQFNQYIFKLEQVEYQNEKIEWSFIEFPDNQDCLDLIEHKLNGILAMIDDECRLPKAADEKLASRMYKALESHSRFSATAPQKRDFKFCIKHYAGNVVYSTITFVEKNKDELPKEASALLQGSSVRLLSELFSVFGGPTSGSATQDKLSYLPGSEPQSRRPSQVVPTRPQKAGAAIASLSSVASQFKGQLVDLMDSIRSTIPHYIRCLKPNDQNISDNFNRIRITEQLRYGGVLEAVRVARSGFPVRLTHSDFYARYRSLANPFHETAEKLPAFILNKQQHAMLKELCDLLLQALWDETVPAVDGLNSIAVEPVKMSRRRSKLDDLHIWRGKGDIARESVQMGLTKVFLRKPAHDVLESRRSRRMVSAARRIQSCFRCFRVCSKYQRVLCAVRLFQRVGRGMIARSRAQTIRRLHSASMIQTHVRRYLARCLFLRIRSAIVSVQIRFRRKKSMNLVRLVRSNMQAVQLQRYIRGLRCKFRFKTFLFAVVVLQNRLRKQLAKDKLKSLRLAAKDVGKLRQSNDALKLEIETLKARAVEETRRLRVDLERQVLAQSAQTQVDDLNALRAELQDARNQLEVERKLRQDAEWAFAASEEKLSSCELRLALVLRSVSEEDGDQASVQRAESKLILSEHALQNATRATRSGSVDKTGSLATTGASGKIGSPIYNTSPLHSPGVGSAVSSPSAASQRKHASVDSRQGASLSPSSRAHTQSNTIFPDSFVLAGAAAAADEKYREAIDALEKEAYARQVLEEEVSRLRQLSMEYKAQVDSLKRSSSSVSNSSHPVSTIATAPAGNLRRFASTSNVLDPRRRTSQAANPAPVVQRVAEEPAQWGKAWDDEDSSSNGDTAIASPRSSISDGASIHGNNPLMVATGMGPTGGSVPAATNHQSAEITSAVSTFERNLDMFRNKLKQVCN
jgi:myosin-5